MPPRKKHRPKYFDLTQFSDIPKGCPKLVDPRKVRIQEQGELRPLIENAQDELAVDAGMMFSFERALHFRGVCHNVLKLWQGEWAGKPLLLEDDWQLPVFMRIFGWTVFSERWNRDVRRFREADVWCGKKNKKAGHVQTPIPTKTGLRKLGDLKVGDELFDRHGNICKVTVVHPIIVDDECYEITFSNGEKIKCNGEHLWYTESMLVTDCDADTRGSNQWITLEQKPKRGSRHTPGVRKTTSLIDKLYTSQGAKAQRIPLPEGLSSRHVHIVSIEPCEPVPCRCITVDSPDGTFLCGRTNIPTHNSPSGAAIGLYMWLFDGEEGQKVFSVAKDGTQAMIIHEHARNMVKASPRLQEMVDAKEIQIYKNTGHMVHWPTNSTYSLLSGDNYMSQEGLNGSFIMDEVHVVPQKLATVLRGMGASRSEPLNFRISTAGAKGDSYGRRRYEYGKEIISGKDRNLRSYFRFFEAPQEATDKELKETKQYWLDANPSWNRTVDPSEFENEMLECQRTTDDWNNFKQRRLGIWVGAGATWIHQQWLDCSLELDGDAIDKYFNSFIGAGGGIGVDASTRNDVTAVTVARHAKQGKIALWTEMWITEEFVEKTLHLVDWYAWDSSGWITIVEGATIKGEMTWRRRADELIKECKLSSMVADDTYCADWMERWSDQYNFTAAAMTQSFAAYAAPTENLENLVVEKKIIHPGNECLDWQFENCMIKKMGDKKKPLKDENQPHVKIDGVQSCIMAVEALNLSHDAPCVYNAGRKIRSV